MFLSFLDSVHVSFLCLDNLFLFTWIFSFRLSFLCPTSSPSFFAFANKFCYEGLKPTYDNRVTTMVLALDDAWWAPDPSSTSASRRPPTSSSPRASSIPMGAPEVTHPPRHRPYRYRRILNCIVFKIDLVVSMSQYSQFFCLCCWYWFYWMWIYSSFHCILEFMTLSTYVHAYISIIFCINIFW
jgi:hypothetical protein